MFKVIMFLSGLILALTGGVNVTPAVSVGTCTLQCEKTNTAIPDEEPILMTGHIKRPGGEAFPGVSVALRKVGQSTPSHTATSDSHGDYFFSGIEEGSYELRLAATGYVTKIIPLSISVDFERTDTMQTH